MTAHPGNSGDGRDLDYTERVALVCNYFCQGYMPSQICEIMENTHGVTMSRELPYKYLQKAARDGWIRFIAPPEHTLREHLKSEHPWLVDASVAHTGIFADVATHAASMLISLLRQRARPPYNAERVHVGFAGGSAMRAVAQRLAEMLREPSPGLPSEIVLHAMVAGFNVEFPINSPNSFFSDFDDPAVQVTAQFVGLNAPPLVDAGQIDEVRRMEVVREAVARRDEIDIVVTSGTSWAAPCRHSMLQEFMQKGGALKDLEDAGAVGDMLWQPIGPDGAIEQTGRRAFTLVDLDELPAWIDDGKWVVLVLGPCRKCGEPRGDLLRTILDMPTKYVSHLVVDSRSASEIGSGRLRTRAR